MPGRLVPLLVLGLAVTACGGNVEVLPDSQSGEDFDRAGAQELFLDKLVDDYVDFEGGDATDWKFFKVKAKGILELTVYWDDHRDIESVIDVRDRFGALIDSRRHSDELEKDKLDLKVDAGTHFVRLYASKGSSVYTIEAVFQPFDYDAPDVEPTPIDQSMIDVPVGSDPIPMTPMTAKPGTKRGGKVGGAAPPPSAPDPPAAGRAVEAPIRRVIEGKGGAVLTLGIGSGDGVAVGTRGEVLGDGGKALPGGAFRITGVTAKSATAFTNLSVAQLANRTRARLFLP